MSSGRFVILHHLASAGEHWDLMLEREETLVTWRLAAIPIGHDQGPIESTRIQDHRKRYLDYEGPISGGRGVVTRVEHGTYELLSADEDSWIFTITGRRIRGRYRLLRSAGNDWVFEHMP